MRTKRAVKSLGIGCLSIVGLVVIFFAAVSIYHSKKSSIAANPERILEKTGMQYPKYKVKLVDDNMERGSSSWNVYEYIVEFEHPLGEEFIKTLDTKCSLRTDWNKEDSIYHFQESKEEYSINVYIEPSKKSMDIEYMWEELF